MDIILIPIAITVIAFLGGMFALGLMYCDLYKRIKQIEERRGEYE